MPNGDNIGTKSILVMSPIYMTSQSGALCILVSVTHFLRRQDIFGVCESLTRIYENCFMGLLSLVGDLVHLRHSWSNGENDRGLLMGLRIKGFEYRKFPLSGKLNCTQFLQNHHQSWKYHRRFGKYDGNFVGTEFYFYTCQNVVCFCFKRDCSMT